MGNNPSKFRGGPAHPVERVSWNKAVEFCRRLSDLPEEKAAGAVYRLPTEAEWEYACRAGTTTLFCFGNGATSLQQYAWWRGNAGERTHPVGRLQPKAWGLFDVHGNVWEWCRDRHNGQHYGPSRAIDPAGPATGSRRVIRGGSWFNGAGQCRSASRYDDLPHIEFHNLGFRVLQVAAVRSRR
jgi:formylglycine-generating enzyme required for sulfatase activity